MTRMQRVGLTLLILLTPLLIRIPDIKISSWDVTGLLVAIVTGCVLFLGEW